MSAVEKQNNAARPLLSILVSVKTQPLEFDMKQVCVERDFYLAKCVYSLIDRSSCMMTKVQQIKKKLLFAATQCEKSFSALAQEQQDFVHTRPYFFFLE